MKLFFSPETSGALFSCLVSILAAFATALLLLTWQRNVRKRKYERLWELADSVFENQIPRAAQVKEALTIFKELYARRENSRLPFMGLYLRRTQTLIGNELARVRLSLDDSNRAWEEHLIERESTPLMSQNDSDGWVHENTRICNRRALLFSDREDLEREFGEIHAMVLDLSKSCALFPEPVML